MSGRWACSCGSRLPADTRSGECHCRRSHSPSSAARRRSWSRDPISRAGCSRPSTPLSRPSRPTDLTPRLWPESCEAARRRADQTRSAQRGARRSSGHPRLPAVSLVARSAPAVLAAATAAVGVTLCRSGRHRSRSRSSPAPQRLGFRNPRAGSPSRSPRRCSRSATTRKELRSCTPRSRSRGSRSSGARPDSGSSSSSARFSRRSVRSPSSPWRCSRCPWRGCAGQPSPRSPCSRRRSSPALAGDPLPGRRRRLEPLDIGPGDSAQSIAFALASSLAREPGAVGRCRSRRGASRPHCSRGLDDARRTESAGSGWCSSRARSLPAREWQRQPCSSPSGVPPRCSRPGPAGRLVTRRVRHAGYSPPYETTRSEHEHLHHFQVP